jgi:protein-tyrosine phosphatase
MDNNRKPGEELSFESVVNFRELGGYRSEDGRTVKHGIFYRSGRLNEIRGEQDIKKLNALGIKAIFDFRSVNEARENPDLTIEGADYYNICALLDENGNEMDFSGNNIQELFTDRAKSMAKAEEMLNIMYGGMPFNNKAFKKLFEAIENKHVPLLFHCNAGKDRTGVAAMLILIMLGVDEETALDDFELTNVYRRKFVDALIEKHKKEVEINPDLPHVFSMMEGVSRKAGIMALSNIKKRYPGGYNEYFEAEYGLTQKKISALRDEYLN